MKLSLSSSFFVFAAICLKKALLGRGKLVLGVISNTGVALGIGDFLQF